jgi:hypothetical protein
MALRRRGDVRIPMIGSFAEMFRDVHPLADFVARASLTSFSQDSEFQ